MSNLGEWIEEKAIEKTIEKTTKELILNMHKYGLSLEKIADIVKKDISEVQEIISNSWLTKRQYSVPRCIGVLHFFMSIELIQLLFAAIYLDRKSVV